MFSYGRAKRVLSDLAEGMTNAGRLSKGNSFTIQEQVSELLLHTPLTKCLLNSFP